MEGLSCRNLSKTYGNNTKALRGISLSFKGNGILAIIGRNGAGKTTLVRILSTELMPSKGSAEINGMDVINDPGSVRNIIAIVPQESRAIQWLTPMQSVMSYLLYRGFGYNESRKKASDALKMLGLKSNADKLNRLLSGGTKRKVMVATVLASDAKVIFLDEPTTGLDPISRNDLWNLLNKLKRDYLIVLTTHYLEEAEKLADKIGVMEQGRLMAFGSMDELRKKVRHQYSIRINDPGADMPATKEGTLIKGLDGSKQILTTEKEAFGISQYLIKKGVKFSTNPVSLEDIFYYIVKKPINETSEGDEDEW